MRSNNPTDLADNHDPKHTNQLHHTHLGLHMIKMSSFCSWKERHMFLYHHYNCSWFVVSPLFDSHNPLKYLKIILFMMLMSIGSILSAKSQFVCITFCIRPPTYPWASIIRKSIFSFFRYSPAPIPAAPAPIMTTVVLFSFLPVEINISLPY